MTAGHRKGRSLYLPVRRYTGTIPTQCHPMQIEDYARINRRLTELRQEHRDLDAAIVRLSETTFRDQLQLTRLKKRKLQLKDCITRLESDLIPDLDA